MIIITGLLIVLVLVLAYMLTARRQLVQDLAALLSPLPVLASPKSTDRILIVAPHSDDETLAAAGYARAALAAGAGVTVVVLTMGDGFYYAAAGEYRRPFLRSGHFRRFGEERQQESQEAVRRWLPGLDKLHEQAHLKTFFLGYPDRGLQALCSSYWSSDRPYRSQFTRSQYVPYPAAYHPGAPHTGKSLLGDLRAIIRSTKPTTIICPFPGDEHPDHRAAQAFTTQAVEQLVARGELAVPRLLSYLVHHDQRWPVPEGNYQLLPLRPPARLLQAPVRWWQFPLTASAVDQKLKAVEAYETQLPLLGKFLRSFVRSNELFAELPAAPRRQLVLEAGRSRAQAWYSDDQLEFLFSGTGLGNRSKLELHLRIVDRSGSEPERLNLELNLSSASIRPAEGSPPLPGANLEHNDEDSWRLRIPLADLGEPCSLLVEYACHPRRFQKPVSSGWHLWRLPTTAFNSSISYRASRG